jgi:hypothetical protein
MKRYIDRKWTGASTEWALIPDLIFSKIVFGAFPLRPV